MKLEIKKWSNPLSGDYYYFITKDGVSVERSQTHSLIEAEKFFQYVKEVGNLNDVIETIKSEEI